MQRVNTLQSLLSLCPSLGAEGFSKDLSESLEFLVQVGLFMVSSISSAHDSKDLEDPGMYFSGCWAARWTEQLHYRGGVGHCKHFHFRSHSSFARQKRRPSELKLDQSAGKISFKLSTSRTQHQHGRDCRTWSFRSRTKAIVHSHGILQSSECPLPHSPSTNTTPDALPAALPAPGKTKKNRRHSWLRKCLLMPAMSVWNKCCW